MLSASTLPVTLCWIRDANDVYEHYLGSDALAVPCGGKQRLQAWPGLESAPDFTLNGIGWKESCADVVLSSAGKSANITTIGSTNIVIPELSLHECKLIVLLSIKFLGNSLRNRGFSHFKIHLRKILKCYLQK